MRQQNIICKMKVILGVSRYKLKNIGCMFQDGAKVGKKKQMVYPLDQLKPKAKTKNQFFLLIIF